MIYIQKRHPDTTPIHLDRTIHDEHNIRTCDKIDNCPQMSIFTAGAGQRRQERKDEASKHQSGFNFDKGDDSSE